MSPFAPIVDFCIDAFLYGAPVVIPSVAVTLVVVNVIKARRARRASMAGRGGAAPGSASFPFDGHAIDMINRADGPSARMESTGARAFDLPLSAAHPDDGDFHAHGTTTSGSFDDFGSSGHSAYAGGFGANVDGTPMLGASVDTSGHAFGSHHD